LASPSFGVSPSPLYCLLLSASSLNGHDFSTRFPLVVAAVAALPVRSCLIDGEAIVSNDSGLAVFELIRSFRHDHDAVLCAFDLLEVDSEDLRRLPIEMRNCHGLLASLPLLRRRRAGADR
jgi:hypothetical protein